MTDDHAPPFSLITMFSIAAILQAVWGLVPSASKLVIDEIPVELYIALRWSISGFIICAVLYFRSGWIPPFKKETFFVGLLGIGGYALGSIGSLYGLKIGGVANFALMSSLSPLVTAVTSILVLKERPSWPFYLALPICIFGLMLLVIGKHEISTWNIAISSACLVVAAAILDSIIFVFSKKLRAQFTALQYMAIAQITAAGFFWVLELGVFHQSSDLGALSMHGWLGALFVSVVACFFCYSVLYWLLNYVDGHRLALFDGLHTLSATLFGVIFFHDKLSETMIFGGGLLLAGLVLGNLRESDQKLPEEPLSA